MPAKKSMIKFAKSFLFQIRIPESWRAHLNEDSAREAIRKTVYESINDRINELVNEGRRSPPGIRGALYREAQELREKLYDLTIEEAEARR